MNISYIVITNYKKKHITDMCLNILSNIKEDSDEIIVVGNTENINNDNIIKIEANDLANTGQISKMRNIGVEKSSRDIVVNLDDDVFLLEDFKKKVKEFSKLNYDVWNTKIILPNGGRWWDRCTNINGNNKNVEYEYKGNDLYYCGGFIIRKRDFALKYPYPEERGYYQEEDVYYSKLIRESGYTINIDLNTFIFHSDSIYINIIDSNGCNVVVKHSNKPDIITHVFKNKYYSDIYRNLIRSYIGE